MKFTNWKISSYVVIFKPMNLDRNEAIFWFTHFFVVVVTQCNSTFILHDPNWFPPHCLSMPFFANCVASAFINFLCVWVKPNWILRHLKEIILESYKKANKKNWFNKLFVHCRRGNVMWEVILCENGIILDSQSHENTLKIATADIECEFEFAKESMKL